MVTAAVFPELVAGRYWVLDADGHDVRPVVIGGGELTEIDLRRSVTVFSGHGTDRLVPGARLTIRRMSADRLVPVGGLTFATGESLRPRPSRVAPLPRSA